VSAPQFSSIRWPRPGSFLWLVRHDLRLAWRDGVSGFTSKGHWRALVIGLGGFALLHVLVWKLAMPLLPRLAGEGAARVAEAPAGVLLGLIGLVAWMTAQGLNGAVRTIYDKGDLDLLLASPVSAAAVFAARLVALAASSFGALAILVLPVAHVGALVDSPRWLALYPVLAMAALAGTAFGATLAMGLVAWVGPRHARRASSVVASLIAGVFVLGGQILLIVPERMRAAATGWLLARAGGALPDALVTGPVAAALGDVGWLLTLGGLTLGAFALTAVVIGRRFAATCRAAAGSGDDGGKRSIDPRRLGFRAGASRALMTKEWRLLRRDPSLIQQLALQLVYTLPIVVILLRSDAAIPVALAVGPALVVIAAQLTGSLAWIAISGEDAPELIAAAPVTTGEVERAKIAAVALPVAALIAVPLAGLALISVVGALKTLAIVALACISTALVNLWHQKPANKRGLLRRHSQSKLAAVLEHTLSLLWAVTLVLALMGSLVALAPAALAVVVLVAISPRLRFWRRRPAATSLPVAAQA